MEAIIGKVKQYTIITSIILMLTAIIDFDAPYWYYQLLRWAVCICAGINAYNFKDKNKAMFIVFCVIAILFNPIAPIYFDKDIWRFIDFASGIALIFPQCKKFR